MRAVTGLCGVAASNSRVLHNAGPFVSCTSVTVFECGAPEAPTGLGISRQVAPSPSHLKKADVL